MTSNATRSISAALKRKRDDNVAFRAAPANRSYSELQRTHELVNINDVTQSQFGDAEHNISQTTARQLPVGDFVFLSESKIFLLLNLCDPTKRSLISIPVGNCDIELEHRFSVSVGPGNCRSIIACSAEGTSVTFDFYALLSIVNSFVTPIKKSLLIVGVSFAGIVLLSTVDADGTIATSQQEVALSGE
jgi:hypothetical protein